MQSQANAGRRESLGQAEQLRHFLLGEYQVVRYVAGPAAIICPCGLNAAEHMPGLPAGGEYPVAELQRFYVVFQHADAGQLRI